MSNLSRFPGAAELAINAAGDALVVLDERMRLVHANEFFFTIFPQAAQLTKLDDIYTLEDWPDSLRGLSVMEKMRVEFTLERDRQLRHYTACISVAPRRWRNTRAGRVIVIHDASEIVRHMGRLEGFANNDSLTGISNRRSFMESAEQEFSKCVRADRPCSVIMFDLDKFKKLNDTYGHSAGDEVLKQVASNIRHVLRPYDLFGRFGGEEFIVFSETGQEEALQLAQRIKDAIGSAVYRSGGAILYCRASGGVAVRDGETPTLDELIRRADMALYRAKHRGRNCVELFSGNALTAQLLHAAEDGFKGFTLYYQPVYSINPWRLVGAESLLRWHSPNGEVIMPDTLIPLLEQLGFMNKLELWVLRNACAQCAAWRTLFNDPNFYICVNLSGQALTQPSLCGDIISTVEKSGVPPQNIVLEFNEIREDSLLRRLRRKDFHVAMDTYGIGKSSVEAAKNMYVDELHIDRSLVRDIEYDLASRKLLAGIVDMSRNLKHRICVPGVESNWQKSFLRDLSVDRIQGYLTGEPADGAAFSELYRSLSRSPFINK